MKTKEKQSLMHDLQNNPQSIAALLSKTGGSNKKLMKFFDWMYKRTYSTIECMHPHLLQGEDDTVNEYQGQPMVWDGSFSLDVNGEFMYSGWAGASGMGGQVQRVVKATDQVITG